MGEKKALTDDLASVPGAEHIPILVLLLEKTNLVKIIYLTFSEGSLGSFQMLRP